MKRSIISPENKMPYRAVDDLIAFTVCAPASVVITLVYDNRTIHFLKNTGMNYRCYVLENKMRVETTAFPIIVSSSGAHSPVVIIKFAALITGKLC